MISLDQTIDSLQHDIILHHTSTSTQTQYASLLPPSADRSILDSILDSTTKSKLALWTTIASTPHNTSLSTHINIRINILTENKTRLESLIASILISLTKYKQKVNIAVLDAEKLFSTYSDQHTEFHRLFHRYYDLVLSNSRLKLELVWYSVQEDIYDGNLDGPRMIRFGLYLIIGSR